MTINSLILTAFHLVATAENFGYGDGPFPPAIKFYYESRLTITRVQYSNPFDVWGKLWDVGVKSAEAVANRVLFYRQEARKRDLDNALVEQEIKQAKIETVEKAYDFVKKLERDGMTKERASRIMAELLDRQGATLSIEAPKEQEPGLRM